MVLALLFNNASTRRPGHYIYTHTYTVREWASERAPAECGQTRQLSLSLPPSPFQRNLKSILVKGSSSRWLYFLPSIHPRARKKREAAAACCSTQFVRTAEGAVNKCAAVFNSFVEAREGRGHLFQYRSSSICPMYHGLRVPCCTLFLSRDLSNQSIGATAAPLLSLRLSAQQSFSRATERERGACFSFRVVIIDGSRFFREPAPAINFSILITSTPRWPVCEGCYRVLQRFVILHNVWIHITSSVIAIVA